MSDDLHFEGKKFISSRRAALERGYTQDYIGQLIRNKKVDARKVGRSWFVSIDSLAAYQQSAELFSKPKNLFTPAKPQNVPALSDIRDSIDRSKVTLSDSSAKNVVESLKYLSDDRELLPVLKKNVSVSEGASKITSPVKAHLKARAILRVSESKIFPKMMSVLGGKLAAGVISTSVIIAVLVSNALVQTEAMRQLVMGGKDEFEFEISNLASVAQIDFVDHSEVATVGMTTEEIIGTYVDNLLSSGGETLSLIASALSDVVSNTRIASLLSGNSYPFSGVGSELYETIALVFDGTKSMIAGVFGSSDELALEEGETFVGGRSEVSNTTNVLALAETATSTNNVSLNVTNEAPVQNFYTTVAGVTLAQVDQRIAESRLIDQSLMLVFQTADRNLRNVRNGRDDNVTATIGGSTIKLSTIQDSTITNSSISATSLSAPSADLTNLLFTTASGTSAVITTATTTNLASNFVSVSGNIKLDSSSPLDTVNRLYANGADLYWAGNVIGGATTGNWTTDGTHAWRATGNVGVGTSSPFAKLSVSSFNGGSAPLFVVSTSTDSGATSTAFVIDAYGSVGVNTSSPNQLDFGGGVFAFKGRSNSTTGSIAVIGNNVINTNPIGRIAFIQEASGVQTNVAFVQALRSGGDDGADLNFMTKQSGSSLTEKMRITSDGRVGIGTSSPAALFTIASSSANSTHLEAIRISNSNPSGWGSYMFFERPGDSARGFVIGEQYAPQSGLIPFIRTAGAVSEELQIETAVNSSGTKGNLYIGSRNFSATTGKIGVATTTPWASLSVAGLSGQTNPLFTISSSTAGFSTSTVLLIDSNGNVGISTSTPSALFAVEQGTEANSFIVGNTGSTTWNGLSSPSLIVKGVNGNGRVGVGTANPSARMEILNTSPSSGINEVLRLSNGFTTGALNEPAIRFDNSLGTNWWSMSAVVAGGTQYFRIGKNLAGDPNTLEEYMRVAGDGNFGVGTTSPWAKISASSTSASPALAIEQRGAGPAAVLLGGNVGIGTTSPGAGLHVESVANSDSVLIVGTASADFDSYLSLQEAGIEKWKFRNQGDSSDKLRIGSSQNASALTITQSGQVGIGMTGPSALFHLAAGTVNGNSAPLKFTSGPLMLTPEPGTIEYLSDRFYIRGSDGVSIAGNVGIGTTSPWAQLSVNPNGITGPSFVIGSSTRTDFIVTNSGEVGLGTTVPNPNGDETRLNVFAPSGRRAALSITGNLADADATVQADIVFAAASNTGSGNTRIALIRAATSGSTANNRGSYLVFATRPDAGGAGSVAERMRIDNVGNVGIGTTSPFAKLSVAGDAYIGGNLMATGTVSLQNFTFVNATGTNATTTNFFSTTASSTNLYSSLLTVAGNGLVVDSNKNVGIGTTNPVGRFQVDGITAVNPGKIIMTDDTNYNPTINMYRWTGGPSQYYQTSIVNSGGSLHFQTGSGSGALIGSDAQSTRMTVHAATGNIGINSTDPQGAKLEIQNGADNIGGTAGQISLAHAGGGYRHFIQTRHDTSTGDGNALVFWLNTSAGAPLSSAPGTGNVKAFDIGYNTQRFYTTGTERLTISSTGNVGIGTTSPFTKLSVSTATNDSFAAYIYNAGGDGQGLQIEASDGSGTNPLFSVITQTGASRFKIEEGGRIGVGTSSPWAQLSVNANGNTGPSFAIGSSTRTDFIVTNGGNVGIGTTTPASKLYINQSGNGSFRLGYGVSEAVTAYAAVLANDTAFSGIDTAAAQLALLNSRAPAVGNVTAMAFLGKGRSDGDVIEFWNIKSAVTSIDSVSNSQASDLIFSSKKFPRYPHADFEVMRLTDGGNVGIGTSTPGANLVVNGTTGQNLFQVATSTNQSVLVINTNGNIGVNAVNPTDKLFVSSGSVAGGITISSAVSTAIGPVMTLSNAFGGQGSAGQIKFTAGQAQASVYGLSGNGGEANGMVLTFRTSSTNNNTDTERMRIDQNGNVGIGTTSPYAKLSVVGEAVARNFTATSTTATSTFAGGFDVGNGAIRYDFSSGVTSIDNATIGSLNFETNAGIVNWADMLVTSAAPLGTAESYTAAINGNPFLTVYSESDGAGGIQNTGVGVGTTTPWAYLSVNPNGIGSGRPLFAIGSSTATQLLLSSAGNLSIGTTTASARLTVTSSTAIQAIFDSTNATGGYVAWRSSGNNNGLVGSGGTVISGGSANDFAVSSYGTGGLVLGTNGGTARMTITNGGNVGVGTTTPGANGGHFDIRFPSSAVNRGVNTPAQLYVGDNSGSQAADRGGRIDFGGYQTNLGRNYTFGGIKGAPETAGGNTGYLAFFTQGSDSGLYERMRIDGLGNMGIGTTTPNFTALGIDHTIVTIGGGASNPMGALELAGSRTTDADLGRVVWANQGVRRAEIYASRIDENTSSKLSFSTSESGSLGIRMTISKQGNVGIGTTTPASRLTVQDTTNTNPRIPALQIHNSAAGPGTIGFGTNTLYNTAVIGTSPANGLVTGQASGDLVLWAESRNILLSTAAGGGSAQMYISSGGNVGIGTTSPMSKLSVEGADSNMAWIKSSYAGGVSLTIEGTHDSAIPLVQLWDRGAGGGVWNLESGRQNGSFSIYGASGGPGQVFTINSSGNVGVGTTTPAEKLTVNGTIQFGGTSSLTGGAANTFTSARLATYTSGASPLTQYDLVQPATSKAFAIWNANSNIVAAFGITGSDTDTRTYLAGNVGIGTTSPAVEFQVYGSNPDISLMSSASTRDQWRFRADDTTQRLAVVNDTSGYGEVMSILRTGNVGIGTTSPQQRLDLWGSANTEIARFTGSGSGDRSFGIGTYTPNSGGANLFVNGAAAMTLHALQGVNIGLGYTSMLGPQNGLLVQGNTGIGTTSPTAKFEVNGTTYLTGPVGIGVATPLSTLHIATGTPSIRLQDTGAGGISHTFGISGGVLSISADTGNGAVGSRAIVFNHFTTELARFATSGNFGIGTSSPYAKLSVVGEIVGRNFTATSTTATSTFAGGFDVGNGAIRYDFSSGATSIENLELGNMTFESDAGILTWTDLPVTAASAQGVKQSYTAAINGNSLLTVYGESNGAGGVQNLGVGVGSTTPWAYLSVNPNSIGSGRPLFAIGSSTATQFMVSSAGNVGIGTTSPVSTLSVQGSLCVRDTGSCGTTAGTIYATTAAITDIDLAENYPTLDATLSAGEIVSLDTTASTTIKRAVRGEKVIGVISTAPGLLLGKEIADSKPVALSGRVPVKINGENGNITIGDKIALSSTAGVGRKAKGSEEVVGTALEGWSGGPTDTGTITIFVSTKQHFDDDKFSIDENGNLGVGTTTPGYRLHVMGDVAATSFVNISTRDAKHDISYLDQGAKESILTKIKSIGVAQYRYNTEDASAPLRLGLIAEEAPVEVLAVGGKGVDVYKLSTFILAGVQEQQAMIEELTLSIDGINGRLDSIDGRLATLEMFLELNGGFASSTASTTASTTIAVVTDWLSGFGATIENAVMKFTNLVADTFSANFAVVNDLTVQNVNAASVAATELRVGTTTNAAAAGITILDRATGQPFCFFITNGTMRSQAGECAAAVVEVPAPSNNGGNGGGSSEPVPEPAPEQTPEPVVEEGSEPTPTEGGGSPVEGSEGTGNDEGGVSDDAPLQEGGETVSDPEPEPTPEPSPEPAPEPAPENP